VTEPPIVTYDSADAVGIVTISRPDRRNALNHAALDQLADALSRARADEVRCLVLTGDADHFCAGADLKELEDLAFTRALRVVLDDLATLAVPTVAAISGACMGLGVQLALSCDLRLATPDAAFAVPVARLGLMVDHPTVQRLALLAGHSTARWLLLTAEPITAAHAHDVGLVHRLVEPEHDGPGAAVRGEAVRLAGHLSTLAPLALAGSKLGLDLLERPGPEVDPDGAYRAAFERAWASEDLVEGRRAFGERRRPEFRGR
jgi:enoyl-CoA hydratase